MTPHGGSLVDLMVTADQRDAVRAGVDRVVVCSDRHACDGELLVVGGLAPLRGFLPPQACAAGVAVYRTPRRPPVGLPSVFATGTASTTGPSIAITTTRLSSTGD